MVNHQKHLLNLSKDQIKKLSKNQNILLKPSNMEGGKIEVYLAPNKLRRMMTAMKKNKGIKIGLSQDELDKTMQGEGFKDVLKKGLKKGVQLVKDKAPKVVEKLVDKAKPVIKKEISKVLQKHVSKDKADKVAKLVADGGEEIIKKAVKKKTKKEPIMIQEPKKQEEEVLQDDEEEEFNPLDMYDAVGGKLRGFQLSGTNKEGGKLNLKKIVKDVSKGYKKYVKDTAIGDTLRKGVKSALMAGAQALPAMIGQPELTPMTTGLVNKYGDTLIKKTGLGVVIQDNHSNFLNAFHPAKQSHIPMQGITDLPRRGGSFLPAGRYGGSFLPSGGSIIKGPMNPSIPLQGITDIPRNNEGKPMEEFIQPSTPFF